jgi:mannose-6-phosphate isomerase-like protein (cupin superfamily)
MKQSVINIMEKFDRFSDHWSPKIFAQMNNYQFKLVKLQGDFVWHSHSHTDETFFVIDGEMIIDFHTGRVNLKSGELIVVPKGIEHKPFAEKECKVMLIEPKGTKNTGDVDCDKTSQDDIWI